MRASVFVGLCMPVCACVFALYTAAKANFPKDFPVLSSEFYFDASEPGEKTKRWGKEKRFGGCINTSSACRNGIKEESQEWKGN